MPPTPPTLLDLADPPNLAPIAPPASPPRPHRWWATLPWVAAAAAVLGPLAVAWPEAARPLVSVLAGVVLSALAIEAVLAIVRRLPHPTAPSPFAVRRERTTDDLPTDLLSITNGMRGLKRNRPIPAPTYWALRRIAADRIALRYGRRVDDDANTAWLQSVVSPTLFMLLARDAALHGIRGAALGDLVTEVERL